MTSVIIGDIINSKSGESPDEWLTPLKTLFSEFGTEPKDWEIFRGDSFQIEIKKPETALLSAIKVKAALMSKASLNVRMAIGIGTKTYDAPKITESNGDAFVRAGEQFESLKKTTLAINTPWRDITEQMNLYIELALLTMDNWTKNSAEIVFLSLKHPDGTQKELAKMLGITQGRVSERQKRAGIDEILKMNDRYRKLILNKTKFL